MQKQRIKRFGLFLTLIFLVVFIVSLISSLKIVFLPSNFYSSYEEITNINKRKEFGSFIEAKLSSSQIATDDSKLKQNTVIFKLFGIIPIKKIRINILPEENVFVGGDVVGLSLNADGVIVESNNILDVNYKKTNASSILKNGDIITQMNDVKIHNIDDIVTFLNENDNENINITILRNNNIKTEKITLLKNDEDKYKLGIWVKDEISGIGTLTFVDQNNNFGSLGHAITTSKDENIIKVANGNIYSCKLLGITKGQRNKPGEIRGCFVGKDENGCITKNTKYGVYGKINPDTEILDKNRTLKLGGRLSVRPGKAKIISNVSGIKEEYEIEIVKANYQSKINDKSIVFKVTDKKLLNLTGGIIQGMSGSPIVQNDKIVGAVTHVFLSDSSKGFGIYTDWMLEQINSD